MPVSNECRRLFNHMLETYEQLASLQDKDFKYLIDTLKKISLAITNNSRAYKDDRVNAYLGISATTLAKDNPDFNSLCDKYFRDYQSLTHSLDCVLDANLQLKDDLETWPFRDEEPHNNVSQQSKFFMELQTELHRRELAKSKSRSEQNAPPVLS